MMYKLFFVVISFSFHYQKYKCTECFDFQCYDGGHLINKNCFLCTEVSDKSRYQWFKHLEQLLVTAKRLKLHDKSIALESKIRNGMYCCSSPSTNNDDRCSLIFSSGAKNGFPHFGMGCVDQNMWQSSTCRNDKIGIRCCNERHCNSPNITEMEYLLMQTTKIYPLIEEFNNDSYKTLIISSICIILILFIGFVTICLTRSCRVQDSISSRNRPFYKKIPLVVKLLTFVQGNNRPSNVNGMNDLTSFNGSHIGSNKLDSIETNYNTELTCSGSGAGKPLITKRTVATDITLIRSVGEGRFGTVWLAKWNGDDVAVKIFSTRDEQSWDRERQIYKENSLRHSNILGSLAAARRDNGLATELWLVTDYHMNGSLYDYLQLHVLTVEQAIKMIRSITDGLAYLHTEINGIDFRPGIAHRDLKSRNILVKSCGECCIGDLGLAVRLNDNLSCHAVNRVGTRRYMAPEIILDNVTLKNLYFNGGLESFKKADIYSYSLVLWEILRCCHCPMMDISPSLYELPYQSLVSNDPSIEEMKEVVCVKKIRPPIKDSWNNIGPIKEIAKSIKECWFEDPSSRLSIMRLKKIMTNVWNEVLNMKSAVVSSSTEPSSSLIPFCAHKYPYTNSDFPSSLTTSDIPNIVIETKDNILFGDSYFLRNEFS